VLPPPRRAASLSAPAECLRADVVPSPRRRLALCRRRPSPLPGNTPRPRTLWSRRAAVRWSTGVTLRGRLRDGEHGCGRLPRKREERRGWQGGQRAGCRSAALASAAERGSVAQGSRWGGARDGTYVADGRVADAQSEPLGVFRVLGVRYPEHTSQTGFFLPSAPTRSKKNCLLDPLRVKTPENPGLRELRRACRPGRPLPLGLPGCLWCCL